MRGPFVFHRGVNAALERVEREKEVAVVKSSAAFARGATPGAAPADTAPALHPPSPVLDSSPMNEPGFPLERPHVAALDQILGKPFHVLDDGLVRVIDYMGSDESIVQAARVSYGAGTKRIHEDRGLIRYLMRHRHTTPFEMCEIKLHVRVPMDCWRQWIRHRTACLAEGTRIYFDLPGGLRRRGNQLFTLTVEELWRRFQPTQNNTRPDKQRNPFFRRDRVREMRLRQVDESNLRLQHTRILNVYKNGPKPVFRMTLTDGKQIEATADHRFLFGSGWQSLAEATGLREENGRGIWNSADHFLYVNGEQTLVPALYRDREWLDEQYNVHLRSIDDLAAECGVSYHAIRKWLRKHGIQHTKGGRSKTPWNQGLRYRLGSRPPTGEFLAANRESRSGEASNFWRGGTSSDRSGIGRWATQTAHRIHARNGWTCQLCHSRAGELHCHHIVPVWADPSRARDLENLTTLCGTCHRSIAGRELDYVERLGGPPRKAEWIRRPRVPWNKLLVAKLVRIEEFEYIGERETYDLEVEGPYHNFVANGIITHNSVNEYSTRYSVAIDSAQKTAPGEWRLQSQKNRQGSEEYLDPARGAKLSEKEAELHALTRKVYEERLAEGISREQARKDLPLSTYTEAYWKTNLHNLLHFLRLRMDPHAQEEIRDYADVIGKEIVGRWCPITWEAFLDYSMNALELSATEASVIAAVAASDTAKAVEIAKAAGMLNQVDGRLAKNREREELEAKLSRLNLPAPWET